MTENNIDIAQKILDIIIHNEEFDDCIQKMLDMFKNSQHFDQETFMASLINNNDLFEKYKQLKLFQKTILLHHIKMHLQKVRMNSIDDKIKNNEQKLNSIHTQILQKSNILSSKKGSENKNDINEITEIIQLFQKPDLSSEEKNVLDSRINKIIKKYNDRSDSFIVRAFSNFFTKDISEQINHLKKIRQLLISKETNGTSPSFHFSETQYVKKSELWESVSDNSKNSPDLLQLKSKDEESYKFSNIKSEFSSETQQLPNKENNSSQNNITNSEDDENELDLELGESSIDEKSQKVVKELDLELGEGSIDQKNKEIELELGEGSIDQKNKEIELENSKKEEVDELDEEIEEIEEDIDELDLEKEGNVEGINKRKGNIEEIEEEVDLEMGDNEMKYSFSDVKSETKETEVKKEDSLKSKFKYNDNLTHQIRVYVKDNCPYSSKIVKYFNDILGKICDPKKINDEIQMFIINDNINVEYMIIDASKLNNHDHIEYFMKLKEQNFTTKPAIFIDNIFVGGCTDVLKLYHHKMTQFTLQDLLNNEFPAIPPDNFKNGTYMFNDKLYICNDNVWRINDNDSSDVSSKMFSFNEITKENSKSEIIFNDKSELDYMKKQFLKQQSIENESVNSNF